MKLSSRARGQIAQLKIELEANSKGYIISRPSVDCYYDILIDTVKSLVRAQIKFCNRKTSGNKQNLELRLDNHGTKRIFYTKTMVDWILVFLPLKNVILKFEKNKFHRRKTITINLTREKSPNFYKKYIW